jgi:hypothetical protein
MRRKWETLCLLLVLVLGTLTACSTTTNGANPPAQNNENGEDDGEDDGGENEGGEDGDD